MTTNALLRGGGTVTPAVHPDGTRGVLIHEAAGLAAVFVPDVDHLIRELAQFPRSTAGGGLMASLVTFVALAAFAHDALSEAGLPTDSGTLTITANARVGNLDFMGADPGYTPEQALALVDVLKVTEARTSTGGTLTHGLDPRGVHVTIHHQKAVPA